MNAMLLTLLIFVLAPVLSYAQSTTTEIKLIYSESSKMFERTDLKGLKVREKYYYNLSGFNPYIHDVKILSVKPVNFRAGFSSKLNEYLGPVDFNADIEFVPSTPRQFPSFDELKQKKEDAKDRRDELLVSVVKTTEPIYLASTNRRTELQNETLIEAKSIEFKENYPIANQEYTRYENLVKSYELLQPQITEFNENYLFLANFYKGYVSLIDSLPKIPAGNAKKLVDSFISYYQGQTGTNTVDDLLKSLMTKAYEIQALYLSIGQTVNNGAELDVELQKSLTDVHKLYSQINPKIIESINSLKPLLNVKTELQTKEQIQKPIADVSRIRVLIINKQNPKDTILLQTVEIPTCNGWDIDFSGGIIYNSIWRQAYSLQVETDPTNSAKKVKEVVKENVFKADIAFAALLNFSYRRCNSRIGPSTGVALSFIDGNLRYLLGLHYHFGYKSALGLSVGGIFGKRTFLSDAVSNDNIEPINPINDGYTSVPSYEKYKLGFYAGLVWNFARK
jgi:hypothetical protein